MPKTIVPPEKMVAEATRFAQQRLTDHIERFAAAYIKLTDIPANEAVMYSQLRSDGIMRIWFDRQRPDGGAERTALKNLLEAVEQRPELADSIESVILQDARMVLANNGELTC